MVDWSQIVQQHGPLVWTSVYRLLRHHADAADCFQRTFLSAPLLSRTQTTLNWPGLLQRLGTARALEPLRERLRQTQRLWPLLVEVAVTSRTPELDQAAVVQELSDDLRQALAQLDTCQAQVFRCQRQGLPGTAQGSKAMHDRDGCQEQSVIGSSSLGVDRERGEMCPEGKQNPNKTRHAPIDR